jgi:hypothetical protein
MLSFVESMLGFPSANVVLHLILTVLVICSTGSNILSLLIAREDIYTIVKCNVCSRSNNS